MTARVAAVLIATSLFFSLHAWDAAANPVATVGIDNRSAKDGSFAFDLDDSRPLVLRFDFVQNIDQTLLDQCGIPSFENPLYAFEYWVSRVQNESNGDSGENQPFFHDRIDLYGLKAPGTLVVTPGIYLPFISMKSLFGVLFLGNSESVEIKVKLSYRSLQSSAGAPCAVFEADLDEDDTFIRRVEPVFGTNATDLIYQRMRDGYARRHMVAPGRGLTWEWLKEYKPGPSPEADRKELLYHSRTMTSPDGKTRVYVPWIDKCEGDACGRSVSKDSYTVFGAQENPLLRGGLAMATFALEYLSTQNSRSLGNALRLFNYVEASEYIDKTGTRTGFFLRSRWPSDINPDTGDPKIVEDGQLFASADEIIGMALGLLYLDDALELAGDTMYQQRLESLVDRLGNQLKRNHYFLLPPLELGRKRGWLQAHHGKELHPLAPSAGQSPLLGHCV
jgi:hypothetical protein